MRAKEVIGAENFLEVHLSAPLEVCRLRAPEMYAHADAGELPSFPGVTAAYDVPAAPDLRLDTDELDVETCIDRILRLLEQRGFISG